MKFLFRASLAGMDKLFSNFIERFGWFGFIRLFFYPLTILLTTPLRLAKTLWNCRILADGRWADYNHFSPFSGIDFLFYWTAALNLYRYGHNGYSPHIGLGNYHLSRWFHYSLISLYSYWGASTITLLLGMSGWLLTHLIWIHQVSLYWVMIVMFLALISTTFYVNTFALQNYNVLGWLFFPLGLYGIFTKSWIIAAIAWFFASFGSFTVVFIASILSVVSAIMNLSLVPILALIPAVLKIITHFYPSLIHKNIKSSFLTIMKIIGMFSRSAKYKDTYPLIERIRIMYFLLLYVQFFIVTYLINGKLSTLFLIGLVMFIINLSFMQFADIQSMQMLMFSLATAAVLQNPDLRLLVSYWIAISPLSLLMPFPFTKNVLDVVPKLAPFYIKGFIEDMEDFLATVKSGERIFMVFDNPHGVRQKIFDGYRVLLELPLYVAAKKEIHFMPNWWAVYDLDYEGAPDFWGRDIGSILKNIKIWKADYVVIYQDSQTALDPKWEAAGFKVLSKFSWANYEKELRGERPYDGQIPDWWLLKIPS